MPATVSRRQTCRLCDSKNVERVVSLQPIPLSENYSTDRNLAANAPRYPVDVYMCADCGHVQHLDVIDPKDLWDSYTYYSGDAKGMPEHFQQVSEKIHRENASRRRGSLVIDIGSNDGSLLKPFKQRRVPRAWHRSGDRSRSAGERFRYTDNSITDEVLNWRGIFVRNTGPRK